MDQPLLPAPPQQKLLPPPAKSRRGFVIGVFAIALVIALIGIFMRMHEATALKSRARDSVIADVNVIKAPHAPDTNEVTLPGSVQAWHEAPIYARTNGYLKDWKTDIGAHVKEGDLLAEIETPEVDAQYQQAEADLATAKANSELAQSTAKRWIDLLKTNSVSRQEADERTSDAAAKNALVMSAQANLDRIKQLQGFKYVVAPFDGVITARNTDKGALINSGNGGSALELFHIADMHKLRVYIQVPENYVPFVNDQMNADLYFPEHPGRTFPAKFAQSANAIDPMARTLLVQLEIDNTDGLLLPGGYTEVHIHVPSGANTVRLPVNTLLFRAEGLQIATVDNDNRIILKPVKIARDFGNEVEIESGITPDENIVINPPDSLENGEQVKIVKPKDDKNAGAGAQKTDDKKKDGKQSGDPISGKQGNSDSKTADPDKSGKSKPAEKDQSGQKIYENK